MEKKEVKIKLSTFTIIFAIIAVLIVGAITYAINLKEKEKYLALKEQHMETERKLDEALKNKETNLKEETQRDEIGGTEQDNVEISKQIGNNDKISMEYSTDEELTNYLMGKIGLSNENKLNSQNILDEILRIRNFNRASIPNELILKLGFLSIEEKDRRTIEGTELVSGKEEIEVVSKEKMKESIYNVFGNNIQYKDASFKLNDSKFIFLNVYRNVVEYKNNRYSTPYFIEISGGPAPYVYQAINKVEKTDNKVNIYVKIAFVDLKDIENSDGQFLEYEYVYKDYDYITDKFGQKIAEINEKDYSWDENNNMSVDPIKKYYDKLNTYVYTFEQEGTTNDYYLSAFTKAE